MYAAQLHNPDTAAGFYMVRHLDSTSLALTTTSLSVATSRGPLTVPQNGTITFNGRDAKFLVTDYVFGKSASRILYSTAEIMTWTTIGSADYIILYAGPNETGETTLVFSSAPTVDLRSAPTASSNFANGVLRLNYALKSAVQVINIKSGQANLVIMVMDKPTAYTWHAPVIPGAGEFGNFFSVGTNQTVLVGGPYLIRSASIAGDTLQLVGDLNGTTSVEFIAPANVQRLSWNGKSVSTAKTTRGSLAGSLIVAQPAITLPVLSKWKVSGSLPEISPDFDDSSFTLASLTTTNYTNLPPLAGDHVLYSQQYGLYGGNLIFRGHFNASGAETAVSLTVQGGFAFAYTAWLNGVFLGSNQGNATISLTSDSWGIPKDTLRIGQDNVLVILQDHMGISETNTNGGKEPRGIRGYALVGGNTKFSQWRLQGNQGGAANAPDTQRGYLNEGGLYSERIGAHLPGFPGSSWANGTPTAGGGVARAGVNFYRTTFDLDLPDGFDVPIRLSFSPSDISIRFRAQIYLNGWQFGKYVNNIGPQTVFVLPAGLLRRKSTNTLALSLWSMDETGASIAGLQLVADGAFATSLNVQDYTLAPDYADQQQKRPSAVFVEPM
ncbi:hypothetical protein HGRIS_005178 [Hohenbuehelia grisea]|uniref:Beta-galactosidase domain-containing protein n=1 Tax=Hohenbuehelia grisea TaxID=104357 RepID=A0ABR3JF73_9AGAR